MSNLFLFDVCFVLGIQVTDFKVDAVYQSQKKKFRQFLYDHRKLQLELANEKQKNSMLKFNYDSIKSNKECLKFFIGLPTTKHFAWVYSMIDGKGNKSRDIFHFIATGNKIVLMKLKLRLYNKDWHFDLKLNQWQFQEYFEVGYQLSQYTCSTW